jgi:hypothetical protein
MALFVMGISLLVVQDIFGVYCQHMKEELKCVHWTPYVLAWR